jgi:hypothetical protein
MFNTAPDYGTRRNRYPMPARLAASSCNGTHFLASLLACHSSYYGTPFHAAFSVPFRQNVLFPFEYWHGLVQRPRIGCHMVRIQVIPSQRISLTRSKVAVQMEEFGGSSFLHIIQVYHDGPSPLSSPSAMSFVFGSVGLKPIGMSLKVFSHVIALTLQGLGVCQRLEVFAH